MKILKFRYIYKTDPYDLQYNDGSAWSRCYEYKFVTDFLLMDKDIKKKSIHNTCWGFEGVHVKFKNSLEIICDNVINSDIRVSNIPNTIYHDITEDVEEFHDKFDYVLNVSTLEHINTKHDLLILNQLKQVKIGGYLIITFDFPDGSQGLNVDEVESGFNIKIENDGEILNGINSIVKNDRYSNLNCGCLIIQK